MKTNIFFKSGESIPMISVLLPVYNAGGNLVSAIESILNQTYTNFELIIINDGSTDDSLSILNHYQAIDSRIIVISRKNRGLVTSLNELLNLARAPWVARMDQDDICLPQRFEKQLHFLQNTGADICGSWIKYFGADNYIFKYYESDEAIKFDMLFKSPFAHPTVMMRTDLAKKLGYDIDYEEAEDYDLWIRAAQAGWIMGNVQEVLLNYRRHEYQITSKSAKINQEVSRRIRERYWKYISMLHCICDNDAEQVQKFILSDSATIVKSANIVFNLLFLQSNGESRMALYHNISHMYIKGAFNIKNINKYWIDLANMNSFPNSFVIQLKIFLVSFLKVKKNGPIYLLLIRCYKFFFKKLIL